MNPLIRVSNLWKQFEDAGSRTAAALRGTSFDVSKGELIAIFGKSGSGKTTLLNLLAGLDRPTKGFIEVEGKDLESLGEKGRTLLRRKNIGFVFQFFNLLPTLTAFENVFLSLELSGKKDKKAALDTLRAVDLEGKEGRFPHELSGGEQQRVAIARAIVKKPLIILADEPTGNLDSRTGNQVLELLSRQCHELKSTLIMATHSSQTCQFVKRILRMEDGIVEEDNSLFQGEGS